MSIELQLTFCRLVGFSWVLSIIFTATYREIPEKKDKKWELKEEGKNRYQRCRELGLILALRVCSGCGKTNDRNYFSILQWGRFIQTCQSWECVRAEPAVICEKIKRKERCVAVTGKSKIKSHFANADVQFEGMKRLVELSLLLAWQQPSDLL